MLRGAEIVLQSLRVEDVDLVFGYPGGTEWDITQISEYVNVQFHAKLLDLVMILISPMSLGESV